MMIYEGSAGSLTFLIRISNSSKKRECHQIFDDILFFIQWGFCKSLYLKDYSSVEIAELSFSQSSSILSNISLRIEL